MEERKKRFSFPSFELKKTSGLISLASPKKRMSTDFTTPPPKKPRQGSPLVNQKSFTAERGGSAPNTSTSMDSAAPYTPPSRNRGQYASPFPSPLGNISSDVFGSPDSQSSPRLVFKTKDCAECTICSNSIYEVRHPHISSQQAVPKYDAQMYFCQICRSKHHNQNKDGRRLSVVLGSSTLHNLWRVEQYRPNYHIDFDTIIGGKIHDVHASFIYQYDKLSNPMDIVLACGVNNIPTDDTAATIIFMFKSFVNTIKEHSKKNQHEKPNRVVISSILYAPKYCDPGLYQNQNHLQKVRDVNAWIHSFNESETGEQMNLHKHGVHGDPALGPVVHKYEEWKEPSKFRKLHLTDRVKGKVAADLIQLLENLNRKL